MAYREADRELILHDAETWGAVVIAYQGNWSRDDYTGPKWAIPFIQHLARWVWYGVTMEAQWFQGWPGYDEEDTAQIMARAVALKIALAG